MSRYQSETFREFASQQTRFSPRPSRMEQIERAESLLAGIEIDTEYPCAELIQHLTGYAPKSDVVLSGREALHDLRVFVEDLSASVDLTENDVPEPVLSIREVSERYNVSRKTVGRWRDRGLASRLFRHGNRQVIGFLESRVDRFVRSHPDEISRSRRFQRVSEREMENIIANARELARQKLTASEVHRKLAESFERAPETIRYTLNRYDAQHPENAVFPKAHKPLTAEMRKEVMRKHKRGVPMDRLVKDFNRTRSSIYRIIKEERLKSLLEQPIDFMDSTEFHKRNADKVILTEAPVVEGKPRQPKAPPGLPPYLASLYAIPLLTKEEEQFYFRKFNYLKCKAKTLRDSLHPKRPSAKKMDLIEQYLDEAQDIKNHLIRSNLRLVVSIAKKHVNPSTNFFEMVSDGNMSLIRAIEKFDYMQGNKFSTYASWAIMKNYARSIPAEHKQHDRYRTGLEEVFSGRRDNRSNHFRLEMNNARQHEVIMDILGQLDDRERDIIIYRYGLEEGFEPETLEQVGSRFGVTKERIRQLEGRALKKLKKIAEDEKLDIPGI